MGKTNKQAVRPAKPKDGPQPDSALPRKPDCGSWNLSGCESPALIHPRTNPQRLSRLRNNGYRSIPSTKQLTLREPPRGERLQTTQQEQP